MKTIQILYVDTHLILISNIIIEMICNKYNIKSISFQDIQNQFIEKKLIGNNSDNSTSPRFVDEIYIKEIFLRASLVENGFLLVDLPRNEYQWELLNMELTGQNYFLEKIWYLRATNLIDGLKKYERLYSIASRANPSLSHINEIDSKSKEFIMKNIKTANRNSILETIDIEAFTGHDLKGHEDYIKYIEGKI